MPPPQINWPNGAADIQQDKTSEIFSKVCFCCTWQSYKANGLSVVPIQLKIKAYFGVREIMALSFYKHKHAR